jgi:hypothetical protein
MEWLDRLKGKSPRGSVSRALAAIVITGDEFETLSRYGATRVMTRLAREAAYYPCPRSSDRPRIKRATPRRKETILERGGRVNASGRACGTTVAISAYPRQPRAAPGLFSQDGPALELMKNLRVVFALMIALVLTRAVAGAFPQCVEFDKPEDLFARSDAVFVGTVLANNATGERGSHAITNTVTIQVERKWKGPVRREMRVGADTQLSIGKRYIVFASGAPLSTSVLCRGAERVEGAPKKMAWLSKQKSQRVR